jgi:secretion system chaperone SscA
MNEAKADLHSELEKLHPLIRMILENGVSYDPKVNSVIDSQVFEGLYGFAYHFYDTGKYSDASALFQMLAAIKKEDRRIWKGLGASLQMEKRYLEAIDAYGMAAILDEKREDPEVHYHAAECLFSVGDKVRALKAITSAIHLAEDRSEYSSLCKRMSLLQSTWRGMLLQERNQKPQQPKNC